MRAEQSGIKILINFAQTIRRFYAKIPAHYDYPSSTRILEGTNNKIKTLTKLSYGFGDKKYFNMKAMGIHIEVSISRMNHKSYTETNLFNYKI